MILEWLEYLVTPASIEAKKWGHLRQSIALRARASRQKQAWHSHLTNCHRAVENFLSRYAGGQGQARSLMILGSGHLFDIPKSIFDPVKNPHINQITLIDLVHPLEIRRRAKVDPRIRLIEMDLSGGIPKSFSSEHLKHYFGQLIDLNLPPSDLIISANIMSQLPLPFVQAAEVWQQQNHHETETFESIRSYIERQMSEFHWRQLQGCQSAGSKILYWTDVEKNFFDPEGVLVHQESSLGDFKKLRAKKSWLWEIAPIPEISKQFGLQMRVVCGELVQ